MLMIQHHQDQDIWMPTDDLVQVLYENIYMGQTLKALKINGMLNFTDCVIVYAFNTDLYITNSFLFCSHPDQDNLLLMGVKIMSIVGA